MSRSIKKDSELYRHLIDSIKESEGTRKEQGMHVPYLDSVGVLTIGYGHNLFDSPIDYGDGLAEDDALELLEKDLAVASSEVIVRWPWVYWLSPQRQAVIIDMAFNLGIYRLSKFRRFLRAAECVSYHDTGIDNIITAAYEMLDSKWAEQVPRRAIKLVKQWLSNEWQK